MTNITLIVIPGSGARQLSLSANTTLADLVSQENLHGRDMIINGTGIAGLDYASTIIPDNAEVFATGSVKGNANRPPNSPSQGGRLNRNGRRNNLPHSN